MADTKITDLADLPTPAGADLLVMVDDVAGTATTKKATLTNVQTTILSGETDPVFLSLSGPWNTHTADTSDPHGATLTQTNIAITSISGPNIQNTGDHILSGPTAFCTGMITHTSATPPTASNYPQGTIYIQYTA